MKKALTVAISLALSAPVYAGDLASKTMDKTNSALSSISGAARDKIEGLPAYDSNGEKFGDVDRIVTSSNERLVVIGIDGALGDGAKEIAVPFSALSLSANNSRLVVNQTAAELRTRPDVDPGDFHQADRDDRSHAVDTKLALRAGDEQSQDLEGMDVIGSNGEQIGDIDRIVIKDGTETAVIGIDGFIGANAKEVAVPLAKLTRAADEDKMYLNYTQEQLKALPDVDPGDFANVDTDQLDPTSARIAHGKNVVSETSEWAELEGKDVYSSSGEKVGDVDRVVMKAGEQSVIIGIDGLLGDGAKEVAVPLSKIRSSATDDRVVVEYSESELKALPDVDPGDFVSLRTR